MGGPEAANRSGGFSPTYLADHRTQVSAIVSALVFLCSLGILLWYDGIAGFHGDESGWISSGFHYADLVMNLDLHRQDWVATDLRSWGYMNPHLGKLMLGIPLRLRFPERTFRRLYDFTLSYNENMVAGNVPPGDLLRFARGATAILGALCCLVVFRIGYRVHGVRVGIIASALTAANGQFVANCSLATTDGAYNLFLLCLALCSISMAMDRRPGRLVPWSLACGALAGLACSVKISGILIGSLFFVSTLACMSLARRMRGGAVAAAAAFFFASLSVVYSLDPVFLPDPAGIEGGEMLHELASLPGEVRSILDGGGVSLEGLGARYPQLANLSNPLQFPRLFPLWDRMMENQSLLPGEGWHHGGRLGTLHWLLLVDYATFPWEWVFLLAGLAACTSATIRAFRRREVSPFCIPLTWFLCNYLFILFFLRLDWPRYFLPTILAGSIVTGTGIFEVARLSRRFLVGGRAGAGSGGGGPSPS